MDKKQTEEMAKIICPSYGDKECYKSCFYSDCIAEVQSEELYNAGYHKPEWISVEDRLPEHNVNCLVFLPYGHLYTGIHVAYYSAKRNMWVDIDGTYLFDHPTHWTPLPTPPTEK